jgi:hypothetical protein
MEPVTITLPSHWRSIFSALLHPYMTGPRSGPSESILVDATCLFSAGAQLDANSVTIRDARPFAHLYGLLVEYYLCIGTS